MVKYVAALDIGTTGLRMLVGKVTDSGSTHIIAKSTVPCKGVKKFQIEDEEEFTRCVKKLLKKIEEQTDIVVKSAYVSIQGVYVGYVRNTAVIDTEDGIVTNSTVADLLDKTSDIELYEEEHLIDVIPVKYILDDTTVTQNPYEAEADVLRVEADILTVNEDAVNQITRCVNAAGLEVDGFIPLSAAMMGLLPDYDRENGSTLLIDVGGSITEFTVYFKEYPFFSASIPVGGDHITNDIAAVLHISKEEAETIKRDYKIATAELVTNNVDVAVFNTETGMQELVKIQNIVEIMEARIVGLLNIIADKLEREDICPDKIDRVIFSGDGLAQFNGLDILCEEIFGTRCLPVDFSRITGMKSCYTYAGGMVMYISGLLPLGRIDSKIEKHSFLPEAQPEQGNGFFNGAKDKVRGWIARFRE